MSEVVLDWATSRGARGLGVLAIAVLVTSCGVGEGGMGLPAQRPGETYPGIRQEIRGLFEVAPNGCFELVIGGKARFVIWPAGSEDADLVRLPDGQVVAEGDTVIGVGALTPTAPLAAPDGYWRRALATCAPGAEEVLVLDAATVDPGG